MKKKLLALLLAMTMVMALVACGGNGNQKGNNNQNTEPPKQEDNTQTPEPAPAPTGASEITLWTYPIGKWGDEATVKALTDAFTAETGIAVKVDYLAYADGDDKVNTALTAGGAPDLIMEGPERLVANWGANGHMVDLSDMFDDTDMAEINAVNEGVMKSCTHTNGAIYEYPLVMTAHCMAVNLNAFKEAGADQYLDLDTHTWTTDDFIKAVEALYAKYGQTVGAVFCAGQGGDQGTRALVNNLYGGTFTNAEHTAYTWDDPLNVKALEQLKAMDGIEFDASLAGGDEIAKFYQGALKMAFCWNIAQQMDPNGAGTGAEKTVTGDDIAFMSFPSEDGSSKLQGGTWGFGIFDNGDPAKVENAKTFIKWLCDNKENVTRTGAFPVLQSMGNLYPGDAEKELLVEFTKMYGPYYNTMDGFANMRAQWFDMLQKITGGGDVTELANAAVEASNAGMAG